jgi:hypothetical protein
MHERCSLPVNCTEAQEIKKIGRSGSRRTLKKKIKRTKESILDVYFREE